MTNRIVSETFKQRIAEQSKQRHDHKSNMEAKHGLVGHPKADRLYELAWDFGHSSGYHEVEIYYDEMADLLKINKDGKP